MNTLSEADKARRTLDAVQKCYDHEMLRLQRIMRAENRMLSKHEQQLSYLLGDAVNAAQDLLYTLAHKEREGT